MLQNEVLLNEFLISYKKVPKKWWSPKDVRLLLELYLEMAKDFGLSRQDKIFQHLRMIKKHESKLAKKRLAEEEEQKEAAKNQKIVAEQSTHMADCFE